MTKHYNFLYLILVASLASIIISCGQETLSDKEIEATVQARVEDKMANMPMSTPIALPELGVKLEYSD